MHVADFPEISAQIEQFVLNAKNALRIVDRATERVLCQSLPARGKASPKVGFQVIAQNKICGLAKDTELDQKCPTHDPPVRSIVKKKIVRWDDTSGRFKFHPKALA